MLTGNFKTLANSVYNRIRVKNSEILELLIYSAYMEEQSKLKDSELSILYNDANYYYQEGQKEVIESTNNKKKPSILEEALFLYLMQQANYSGFTFEQYIQATIQYNTQQIYKQAVINIMQDKELKTNSDEFQRLFNQQNNRKLCINGDKISGSIDLHMIGLNNQAKVEGIKKLSEDDSKVKFVAVIDDVTTKMCNSLNGQEFYINKENEFKRYYGETQKDLQLRKVKCKGLVLGINLPPITHHYHHCRSYIMYLPPIEKEEETEYNTVDYVRKNKITDNKILDKSIKKAINLLPQNIQELIKDTKYKISNTHSYYDRNNDTMYLLKDSDEYEVLHEIGHTVETKLDVLHNDEYIKIQKNGLEDINPIVDINKIKGYGQNDFVKDTGKFISEYQRRVYENDIDNNSLINYDNFTFNAKTLGEYFSEGFRCYFENNKLLKDKDINLYNYIKEVLK